MIFLFQKIRQESMKKDHPSDEAKKPDNKLLNRYRDVNPYDHSRVILTKPGYNYINASYIPVSWLEFCLIRHILRGKTHDKPYSHLFFHSLFLDLFFVHSHLPTQPAETNPNVLFTSLQWDWWWKRHLLVTNLLSIKSVEGYNVCYN